MDFFSIVFIPFKVPLFSKILTHAVRTGYDQHGRCRRFLGPPKGLPEKEDGHTNEPFFSKEDADVVMGNFIHIATGKELDLDTLNWRPKQVVSAALEKRCIDIAKGSPILSPSLEKRCIEIAGQELPTVVGLASADVDIDVSGAPAVASKVPCDLGCCFAPFLPAAKGVARGADASHRM